jgi:hypothetical protein
VAFFFSVREVETSQALQEVDSADFGHGGRFGLVVTFGIVQFVG